METYKELHILNVSTTPHPSNQYVMKIGETLPTPSEVVSVVTLYNDPFANLSGEDGRRATAFRLSVQRNRSSEIQIPLKILAQYEFEEGGTYSMTAEGDGFRMKSKDFVFRKDPRMASSTYSIGPFFANVTADCPFRIDVSTFTIHEGNRTDGDTDHALFTMFFFLGSSALPLNVGQQSPTSTPNVHLYDLIQLTIPPYDDIVGKAWAEIEQQQMEILTLRFWRFGDIGELRYDSNHGRPHYFFLLSDQLGAVTGHFLLADMLKKTAKLCNCYDLAAIMYTAFKSFGKVANGTNASETDVSFFRIENAGEKRQKYNKN